ncbi:DinB family protein [Pedobacter arcticus]|uniref:DinB family protein n=1 Tax=Pedobacter arcticus TaxID=752140 RepID=UPI0002EFB2C7|nr:DinB family protein [Pedobacter arcticus]
MRTFFSQLFEYNHQCNQKFAELLSANEDKLTDKSKNLSSHLISAHQIWNSRILADERPFEVWQIHPVSAYKDIDQINFEHSLKVVRDYDFDLIINYKTSSGLAFENTIRDILFHIINHSTYHRAQIAMQLKTVEIEPLSTDWIMYKR